MEYKGFTYTPTPKTAWDNLSMLEKSEMMKVAVKNGITDLKTIREKYNEFAEGGYLDWKERASKYKHLDIDNDRTYDYEGWYNENPQRAWDFLNDNPDAHFDDKYKTVYHPTFSTQSRYSGIVDPVFNPDGLVGGTWNKQGTVFTMSPDGYRGPVSMDERAWYLMNAEDNGVQLREADSSLPVFDGIPWGGVLPNVTVTSNKFAEGGIHIKPENRGKFTALKERTGHSATWFKEHGTPAQKKMATFALNARHWKHGLGGNLFDGISEDTQQIQIGRPFYSYDWNGNMITDADGNPILNYNVSLPEVTIVPDSRLSPAEKNYRERQRQVNLADYAEQQARDYTTRQSLAAQREWENSPQKKALDLGIAAAQGIGMASDVVSPFFGGIPVYSGLKGAQALDRATNTNEVADYADAALWLSPMLTVAGKKIYDVAKPAVQRVFQKGTPAAEWAGISRPAFKSELDWSPEGWFGTRATGKYDAEDVSALQAHIPEYLDIERASKANGTWLRMPDGSMWEGDPRSWVQMQSKAYDAYTGNSPFKYQAFSHTSPHKFDTFDYSHFGETDEGFYGRGFYTHPAEKINGKLIGRNTYGDEDYLLTTNVQKPFDLNNSDFEYAGLFNRQNTNAPKGLFDGYDAVYYGVPGKTMVGAFPSELVVPKPNNYKSLLGNNGNFNKAAPNIYKGLVPFVLGGGTLTSFQTK